MINIKQKILATIMITGLFSNTENAISAENRDNIPEDYKLEQILIFSRHGVRSPVKTEEIQAQEITNKQWPKWNIPEGYLTTKGLVLSTYMGKYTADWLTRQKLVKKDECPDPESIYVYTNSLQRTIATGHFFIAGAFPTCNIRTEYKEKLNVMDPLFDISFKTKKESFYQEWNVWMEKRIKEANLNKAYTKLEKILDFKNSPECQSQGKCNLKTDQNSINFHPDKLPKINGPLGIANAAFNIFMLEYYEGFRKKDLAFGKIKSNKDWNTLSDITKIYTDTLFSFPEGSEAMALPQLQYIRNILIDTDLAKSPKITLMVGHDSNIAPMLVAMKCKAYDLPGQYERIPIGGNIQFQRWRDQKSDRTLFRLEYVYQSAEQLRNETELTKNNPPHRVTLKLEDCPTDNNGFCSWSDFTKIMQKFDEKKSL